jgi:hypothetical protein
MVLARRLEAQMGEITSANAEATRSSGGGDGKAEEKRERAMAEAALTLAEIGACNVFLPSSEMKLTLFLAETLLSVNEDVEQADDDPEALLPIRSLTTVEAAIPAVELSRQLVVEEMESAVQRGLTDLVRSSFFPFPFTRLTFPAHAGPPHPRLFPTNSTQPLRPPFSRRQPCRGP